MGFSSESQLVRQGRRLIRQVLAAVGDSATRARYEVTAPGSVPDLVLFSRKGRSVQYVVSIEFKLSNWRRAIGQAFRHRNFGNEAYVVLDEASIAPAVANVDEFKRTNIGLLSISSSGELKAWFLPEPRLPFSAEFSVSFSKALLTRSHIAPAELPYVRSLRGGVAMAPLRSHLENSADQASAV